MSKKQNINLIPGEIYTFGKKFLKTFPIYRFKNKIGKSIYIEKNTERAWAFRKERFSFVGFCDLHLFYHLELNEFWTIYDEESTILMAVECDQ